MRKLISMVVLVMFAVPALASDLCDEVTNDPLARGYATMTNAEVVADLYTVYRTRPRTSMTGQEVWETTAYSDFSGKSDGEKAQWLALTANATLDPYGNSVELAKSIFGAGSETITALANARIESISRVEELGLGVVKEGFVGACRQ
jgi:hypothetical protein